ncbi:MAG: OmpA family protein [Oceanospirillaceae bacterium]|nr:OmpA family protein [Oceanospirillaceae bacterium]
MNNSHTFKKVAGIFALSLIVAGCASSSKPGEWDTKRVLCVAAGGLAGVAADSVANRGSDGKSKAAGALVGVGLGAIFCSPGVVLDGDQDGVADKNDECPYTPLGTAVNEVGCSLDDDKDGVANSIDQCPNTPLGTEVDETGCEVLNDQDGDGVLDEADQCPDTAPGTAVNSIGCEEDIAIVLEGVFFEYKSFDLTADSQVILNKVAGKLAAAEALVLVAGHTDSVGGNAYNIKLSDKRAASVKDYLVSQGVPVDNISSQGFGEDNPIASNETDEGRAQNRRVEMQIQN